MNQRPSSIAQEIHQTKPFHSVGHEAALTLYRTAAVLERNAATLLAGSGITPAQYNVLRILRGAGPAGLPTLTIRDRMVDLSPGVTRLIDRLAAVGLVTRDRGSDRRQVLCRITTAGLALLKKLDPLVEAADDAVVARLTPAEQRTLIRLLDLVRSGLRGPATTD
jgi:DNA-binding MarR family transcriptional regulator